MTIKEYQKDLNKDVSDFLTELQQKFPDTVITSGFRKNSVTKFGKKSRHSTGEAVDLRINPEISDWLYNTKEGITTLNKYGLGMLDESLPENKKFGNAIHIGKDVVPVEKTKNRYKELFGVEYGQETQKQEQENVINYVSPTQDTTIVTNLPKSEESINFAEETRKLEQQKQEEFQKIEQEINQRTQVQPQEQQIEEEEYVQPTPQVNYQDIFNQVSQFVDTPIAQQGGTWSKQQQALKEEKLAKLKKLLEQEKPVYKKKTFDEKLAEKRQEQETKVVAKDSTANRNYNDATKHSNVARNKTDKEIAEERKAIREKSDANVLNSWSLDAFKPSNYTRENIAEMAQGLESKFRVSDEPNFFDDYLNPANMIGEMASNLGQAPLQAEQTDSYMPYVTAVGTPLAVGTMAGYGTQSTGQFVNNLANPLAGTGEIVDKLGNRYLPKAYTKNPFSFTTKEGNFYRQVDDATFQEALESGLIRGKQDVGFRGAGNINLNRNFGDLAYYNKNTLYYPDNTNLPYLYESLHSEDFFTPMLNNRTKGLTRENTNVRVSNTPFSSSDPLINTYKKDWLQGYKPLNNNLSNPSIPIYRIARENEDFQQGGIKTDPMGYWNPENIGSPVVIEDQEGQRKYPNKITKIKGNIMSTEGYGDIPLYVIPNVGEPKLIFPNTGTHFFPKATDFIEYPIKIKDGK